jgi:hypothetical protein
MTPRVRMTAGTQTTLVRSFSSFAHPDRVHRAAFRASWHKSSSGGAITRPFVCAKSTSLRALQSRSVSPSRRFPRSSSSRAGACVPAWSIRAAARTFRTRLRPGSNSGRGRGRQPGPREVLTCARTGRPEEDSAPASIPCRYPFRPELALSLPDIRLVSAAGLSPALSTAQRRPPVEREQFLWVSKKS